MDKFRKRIGLEQYINHQVNSENKQIIGYSVETHGRLGNHMFLYAYTRLLAESEGRPFIAKSKLLRRVFGVQEESETRATSYQRPKGSAYLQDPENLDLILQHRKTVREWFKLGDSGLAVLRDRGFPTVVHVRGSDFKQLNWTLPFSYYASAMSFDNNFLVITDDIKFARKLLGEKFEILNTPDDLSIIYNAKKIIVSYSTFCWWGTFLGSPEQVIAPSGRKADFTKPVDWALRKLGWKTI